MWFHHRLVSIVILPWFLGNARNGTKSIHLPLKLYIVWSTCSVIIWKSLHLLPKLNIMWSTYFVILWLQRPFELGFSWTMQLLLMLTTAMLSNCRQPCHSWTKKAYQGQLSHHPRSFWWQRFYPSSYTFQPLDNWHLHQSFDAKSISVLHKQITTGRFPNINLRGY